MQMNFPYVRKKLRVRQLGGDKKEIGGRLYDSRIKNLHERIHHFKAHGLDRVTRDLGSIPNQGVLREFFSSSAGHREYSVFSGGGLPYWVRERHGIPVDTRRLGSKGTSGSGATSLGLAQGDLIPLYVLISKDHPVCTQFYRQPWLRRFV